MWMFDNDDFTLQIYHWALKKLKMSFICVDFLVPHNLESDISIHPMCSQRSPKRSPLYRQGNSQSVIFHDNPSINNFPRRLVQYPALGNFATPRNQIKDFKAFWFFSYSQFLKSNHGLKIRLPFPASSLIRVYFITLPPGVR